MDKELKVSAIESEVDDETQIPEKKQLHSPRLAFV
eukprot:CAMPEP_0184022118 /NCGR_PEP_ID=MMETSP0954-20121128/10391_1 /TAXON_ID=627963 /ORGANISM="Aplanochytrium sp, Strain PBS07" /LENGTH=34 /DNA_ID= /DNA_START= /DNA_END= /DNA_ORIENTATION=